MYAEKTSPADGQHQFTLTPAVGSKPEYRAAATLESTRNRVQPNKRSKHNTRSIINDREGIRGGGRGRLWYSSASAGAVAPRNALLPSNLLAHIHGFPLAKKQQRANGCWQKRKPSNTKKKKTAQQ